ncbi:hypothetical protein BDV93DRAFT_322692 [Ceratobasidium sp. AG-I]|nr:hypothetical protein BDV93DRAFT_322692 [Ceratobasidium sp. AG-I]
MTSARRVAGIPELSVSIAASLSDRHPLLLTSKQFFYSVAPLLWKSVPRVDILLRLIPGTNVSVCTGWEDQNPNPHSVLVDVTLPSALDLTRFALYAPWVQRLEVFGGDYEYILHNADALSHLASTGPILPNLRALTLTVGVETSTAKHILFTELFLSPTLTEIRHVRQGGDPPYLKIHSVPGLVQKIFGVCPSIEILELYPGEVSGQHNRSRRIVTFSLPDAPLHVDLARFSNLRSFTSTLHIFQPTMLQVLGSLPLLESLDVFDCLEDYASLEGELGITETCFPALRHLHLRNLDAEDISLVWSQPFVRNLESATIKCDPASIQDFDPEAGQEWVDSLLTKLPQASPHISKLELDFEGVPFFGQWTFSVSRAGIGALRQLPLRSIRLYFIWAPYEDLVPALPGVEEFYCMEKQIEIEQLRVFAAHMPRLRSLTVDVRWNAYVPWETAPTANRTSQQVVELSSASFPPPPIVLISRFKLAELGFPITQLRNMAKFLAELWPGGFRGEGYPETWEELEDEVNAGRLSQLNELVSRYWAEVAAKHADSAIRQA